MSEDYLSNHKFAPSLSLSLSLCVPPSLSLSLPPSPASRSLTTACMLGAATPEVEQPHKTAATPAAGGSSSVGMLSLAAGLMLCVGLLALHHSYNTQRDHIAL